jgi:hypothetical protein
MEESDNLSPDELANLIHSVMNETQEILFFKISFILQVTNRICLRCELPIKVNHMIKYIIQFFFEYIGRSKQDWESNFWYCSCYDKFYSRKYICLEYGVYVLEGKIILPTYINTLNKIKIFILYSKFVSLQEKNVYTQNEFDYWCRDGDIR